jgi:hypothetical protein
MKVAIIIGVAIMLSACGKPYDQKMWSNTYEKCSRDYARIMITGERTLFCEDMAYKAVGHPERSPLAKYLSK